jgi:hypothetical protein
VSQAKRGVRIIFAVTVIAKQLAEKDELLKKRKSFLEGKEFN